MKRTLAVPFAVGLVAAIVSAASAVVFPGGGPKKSDCYVGAEVDGMTQALEAASSPVRADMKACSSSCTFSVKECIDESASVAGCTAQSLTSVTIKPLPGTTATISPPLTTGGAAHVCGDAATVTVADKCTDVDNGWTGISHNFPVTPGSQLFLCVSGCDTSTNPNCTATGPIGAGSLNGVTFGPPLPLLAAQVPVCVLNRFQTP